MYVVFGCGLKIWILVWLLGGLAFLIQKVEVIGCLFVWYVV